MEWKKRWERNIKEEEKKGNQEKNFPAKLKLQYLVSYRQV
jgi:hypothetical protein